MVDNPSGIISPYRRTNHALSHLYHDVQCRPCTLRSISCEKLGIWGLWYKWEIEHGLCACTELKRGDYRPYRRTNHALSHLYHDTQCRPCTLRSVSCWRLDICGLWYKVSYQPKQPCSLISVVAICKRHVRTIKNVKYQDQSNFQKFSTYFEDLSSSVLSEDQRRGLLQCLFDHLNAFVTDENPNLGFTYEVEHTNLKISWFSTLLPMSIPIKELNVVMSKYQRRCDMMTGTDVFLDVVLT